MLLITFGYFSGFVGGHVIVICSYGPETVLLPVNQSTTFSDFLNCVALRFGLKAGMFDLKYSLEDYPSCALCSDVDLKLMLQVLVVYEKAYVNVRVIDVAAKSVGDESNLTIESDVGFCDDNEADYLGDFRPEDAKLFLSRQWKDYIKSVDQKFVGGAREFREKLCLFAVEMGFMFRYTRNDKWRVSAVCSQKESQNCEWHVNASACPTNKFFYINQLTNVHTCSSVLRTRSHALMSSSHVKMLIIDEFRSNPSLKTKDIINRMLNSFGIDISYRVAWIAREKALKELHGSDEESFANLIWYRAAILETNPGSVFDLEWDPITGRFQRLFLCFGGVIEGFKSCIPLLFVDGAHVKSKYKGAMLSATGKDGNQGKILNHSSIIVFPFFNFFLFWILFLMCFVFLFSGFFPFAVAVVNNETDDNWNWFFEHLKAILDPQGRMITFVSDRGIGLLSSLKRVFPENPHSYCLYHLKLNLADMIKGSNNKALRSTLVDKFNNLAYSRTERQYYYNLNIFLAEGQDVARAFLTPPS